MSSSSSVVAAVSLFIGYVQSLSEEVPSDLLSTPLKQRHTFLDVDKDDSEYLLWPADNNDQVADLLRTLVLCTPDIRFTGDGEQVAAHVNSSGSPLRLIFIQEQDSWKYHNAALMPFPVPNYESVDKTLLANAASEEIEDGDDDDGYWDNYGSDGHQSPKKAESATVVTEDAYWARHTGTADSAIPSPLPRTKSTDQVVFTIPATTLQPPSLSRENPPYAYDITEKLEHLHANQVNDLATEPVETGFGTGRSPSYWNGFGAPSPMASRTPSDSRSLDALKDSIRGLYALWSLSKTNEEDARIEFVEVVKGVINHS